MVMVHQVLLHFFPSISGLFVFCVYFFLDPEPCTFPMSFVAVQSLVAGEVAWCL